jgi:hypothetical protein
MNRQIDSVSIVSQIVHVAQLNDIDHNQVASDIELYAVGIEQESPEYGWISRGFVQHEDLVMPVTPEITKLEFAILQTVKQMTNRDYKIDDMWAVKLVKNQSVIAHSHHSNSHVHPEEFYSVAYYPQAPEGSAELIFSANWCGVMQTNVPVKAEKGKLVIFNSYLTHMTARHSIDEPRLVVSMNLAPVIPNVDPNADWSVYWNRPVIDNPKLIK